MARKVHRLKDAKEFLEGIHQDIVATIRNGFEDWVKIREFANTLEGGAVNYMSRTKAGLIHDHIKKYALSNFSGKDGIKIDDFKGVFGMVVQDELFIRFKKMDKEYSVRSAGTHQNKKYMKQGQIEGFPENPTFLFAGYIPDRTWSSIKGIYVACWVGNTLEWVDEAGRYSTEQTVIDFDPQSKNVYKKIEKRIKVKTKKGGDRTGTES